MNKKEVIIKVRDNGTFKLNKFKIINIFNNKHFKLLYKNKMYDKEVNIKQIKQISQVVEALNINNKKRKYEYVYDKACEVLDSSFYGKNVCEFRNNKCIHDRVHNASEDGCCRNNKGNKKCMYLDNHLCTIKCLACKFHICHCIREKGLKYKVNDILVLKYILNIKQKIMIYNNFFMTKEENIKDLLSNSIIIWVFKKSKEKWIETNNKK